MSDLKIETIINLPDSDVNELAKIIGCSEAELEENLKVYSSAALQELISMFLGQKVFSRGSNLLEYKLYLLIKNAFSGRIPNEQRVCRLFQKTSTGSRSLIRAVMSKYHLS